MFKQSANAFVCIFDSNVALGIAVLACQSINQSSLVLDISTITLPWWLVWSPEDKSYFLWWFPDITPGSWFLVILYSLSLPLWKKLCLGFSSNNTNALVQQIISSLITCKNTPIRLSCTLSLTNITILTHSTKMITIVNIIFTDSHFSWAELLLP